MERTIAYQLQSCSYLVQTTSGSPIMESVMRRSYIPLFIPHCPSPSLGPVQNFEILLFEKIENLEIHFEKIKILFSLQSLLKVRGSAVILRYWSLETVHGARRTRRMKFEIWKHMDLLATFPSLRKEGKIVNKSMNFQISNFNLLDLRAPWTDSDDQ